METSQSSRYITPTLQANFNLAIGEVIKCLNESLIIETWEALQSLYNILPPEIYEEVTEDYEDLTKILGTKKPGVTYFQHVEVFNYRNTILRQYLRPFFREMYEQLYNKGYLEKKHDVPIGTEG